MYADPVIAERPIRLRVDRRVREHLVRLSGGRPLVLDYYVTRCRGLAYGDLRARFTGEALPPRFVRIAPVGPVEVLVDRRLLDLIVGAELRIGAPSMLHHLMVRLARPEKWLDFLERFPSN
jgi:hypothetical protein